MPAQNIGKSISGITIPEHDRCEAAYPDAVTTVFTYRQGGATGAICCIVTVVNDAQGRFASYQRTDM